MTQRPKPAICKKLRKFDETLSNLKPSKLICTFCYRKMHGIKELFLKAMLLLLLLSLRLPEIQSFILNSKGHSSLQAHHGRGQAFDFGSTGAFD
jgi:hypothetical protein